MSLPGRNVPIVLLLLLVAACATPQRSNPGNTVKDAAPAGRIATARGLLRTDPARAERILTALLARAPTDGNALNDLGIALDLQGRHEDARSAYRQALAAAPTMTAARLNLALSLAISAGPHGHGGN